MQGPGLYGRVALQAVAQAFGHRQHPLAHRQARYDVIDEMGCGLDHAPGVACRTHAAALAGEDDQEVVPTLSAAGPSKAVAENATFEVAAEFALDVGRHRADLL